MHHMIINDNHIDQLYLKIAHTKKLDSSATQSATSLAGAGTGGIVLRRTKSVEHYKGEELSITSSEDSEIARHKAHQKRTSQNDLSKNQHQRDSSCSTSEYSEEMQTAFRGDDAPVGGAKGMGGVAEDKSTDLNDIEEISESAAWEVPKSKQRTRHNFTTPPTSSYPPSSALNTSHGAGGESSSSSTTSSYRKYLDNERRKIKANQHHTAENQTPADREEDAEFVTYRISQLSLSFETTVFHYCHFNVGQGVYLSPLKPTCDNHISGAGGGMPPPLGKGEGPLHQQFLANFQAACQVIHSTFKFAHTSKQNCGPANTYSGAEQQAPASSSKPWTNTSLVAVREQVRSIT